MGSASNLVLFSRLGSFALYLYGLSVDVLTWAHLCNVCRLSSYLYRPLFAVEAGDRIAQLVLERISTPDVEVVESLDETVRGAGGFGSTGMGTPSVSSEA